MNICERILSFAKNMGKIIKYGLKLIDHAKQSAIDVVKTALNRGINCKK